MSVRREYWIWTGMGVFAFLFYVFTGARTIQWQDSAQFTCRVAKGAWENQYGLAMVHPLHFGLGRLAALLVPPEALPWALSGVSALGGAVAVALVAGTAHRETRSVPAACYAGGVLLLAHTFWRFSGLPEVYTISAALLILECSWFLRMPLTAGARSWGILFFLNGLALANHNLALLSLPVWGICWMRRCLHRKARWPDLRWIAGGWILGASPFLLLVLVELGRTGDPAAVLQSALFGYSFQEQVTGLLPEPKFLGISLGFLLLSFPLLPWLLALRSVVTDPGKWGAAGVLVLIHLLFFLRYNVIDQYTFFIPVMSLLALLAGAGFASGAGAGLRRACVFLLLLQPFGYALAPGVIRSSGVMRSLERAKPYRDDYRYLFWPWMAHDRSADRLAGEVAEAAEAVPGAIGVGDAMAVHTLAWRMGLQGQAGRVVPSASPEETDGGIWVPARSDTPVESGWRKQGEIWVREQSVLDSVSGEE